MAFTIKAFQQGKINEVVEVSGCEAAWDRYQFYRMAFPMAQVAMIDERTGEIIISTMKGGE